MVLHLNKTDEKNLINFIKKFKKKKVIENMSVYIGVNVGKKVLDISVVIGNSEFQCYLGTIDNNISGFKQVEKLILNLIVAGIDENHIFFACENTGIYTHDCMDYFDKRLFNTYVLKSSLTFQARKYYAKADFKTDLLDSAIVALTLNDLHKKGKLECIDNLYNKDSVGIGFVRRSFGKEMCSLRHIFRMIAELRNKKSEIVTSIGLLQYRIFPEIEDFFGYRSQTKKNIIDVFTRDEILAMDFDGFQKKYKEKFGNKSLIGKTKNKCKEFFCTICNRGEKTMCSNIDKIVGINDIDYVQNNISIKYKEFDLIVQEMDSLKNAANQILDRLVGYGFFIPRFRGISRTEMGLFLGELGEDIYEINSHSLLGFAGRHPNVYESGGGTPTKVPKFSTKKSIIKKYLYVWMGGFCMHNPSFRLYKNLLAEYYGITTEKSITNSKLKKKIGCKAGEKLLKIILICFKNKCGFDENRFILDTILPLVDRMRDSGTSSESINSIIEATYKTTTIPESLQIC